MISIIVRANVTKPEKISEMLRHIASMFDEGYTDSIYPEWHLEITQ